MVSKNMKVGDRVTHIESGRNATIIETTGKFGTESLVVTWDHNHPLMACAYWWPGAFKLEMQTPEPVFTLEEITECSL